MPTSLKHSGFISQNWTVISEFHFQNKNKIVKHLNICEYFLQQQCKGTLQKLSLKNTRIWLLTGGNHAEYWRNQTRIKTWCYLFSEETCNSPPPFLFFFLEARGLWNNFLWLSEPGCFSVKNLSSFSEYISLIWDNLEESKGMLWKPLSYLKQNCLGNLSALSVFY